MTEQIDISKAGKKLASLIASGETYELTRYGKIAAYLVPPEKYQMEHLATDPQHRPVPESLSMSYRGAADHAAGTTTTVSVTPTDKPQTWMERNAAQSARDEILRGINKKKG